MKTNYEIASEMLEEIKKSNCTNPAKVSAAASLGQVLATLAVADELRELVGILKSLRTDGKDGGKALEVKTW